MRYGVIPGLFLLVELLETGAHKVDRPAHGFQLLMGHREHLGLMARRVRYQDEGRGAASLDIELDATQGLEGQVHGDPELGTDDHPALRQRDDRGDGPGSDL